MSPFYWIGLSHPFNKKYFKKKYLTNDGFMLKLLYIIKYFKLIKFIKEKT